MLQFMSEHPYLTFFLFFVACETIVRVVEAITRKTEYIVEDEE